jgi:hypothetical protein
VEVDETETRETARTHIPHLAVVKRSKNFCEVELCLSASDAMAEARRCLRCDLEFTAPSGEPRR